MVVWLDVGEGVGPSASLVVLFVVLCLLLGLLFFVVQRNSHTKTSAAMRGRLGGGQVEGSIAAALDLPRVGAFWRNSFTCSRRRVRTIKRRKQKDKKDRDRDRQLLLFTFVELHGANPQP